MVQRIISFIAVLLLVSCSSGPEWQGAKEIKDGVTYMYNPEEGLWQEKKRMEMEEVLTIGVTEGDNDYILARPTDIITDENSNIYILDTGDHCIKVYGQRGEFLRKIGKQGQGPGELWGEDHIVITHDDKLGVLQFRKISFFTLQGEFINSNPITELNTLDITTVSWNDHIYVTQRLNPLQKPKFPFAVIEYNSEGDNIGNFGELVITGTTETGKIYSNAYISGLKNGKLLVTYNYPYRIDFYNKNFEHCKTIFRETEIFEEPKKYKHRTAPIELLAVRAELLQSTGLELPDGKLIIPVLDNGPDFLEKRKTRELGSIKLIYDLYDPEGRFLQSFYWKDPGEEFIYFIDQNGFAFTMSGPNEIPKVRKYRISFVEK